MMSERCKDDEQKQQGVSAATGNAVRARAAAGPTPSRALLRAAMSGLLSLGVAGCSDDDDNAEPDPDQADEEQDGAECEPMACECDEDEASMSMMCPEPDLEELCGRDGSESEREADDAETVVEKELSTEDIQHTYAELVAMCEEREGYVEIHGSCAGVNTCKGFFYGDWGEGAQLVEHTCSGVNGCNGLSCLIPGPAEEREPLTGEEIMRLSDAWYSERVGDYGPRACKTCHVPSEYDEEAEDYKYDFTKLKLPMWPDSGRDIDNWLDRSAVQQEKLIAFGAQGMTPDGIRFSNMASYANLFTKAEIQAVVEYMRSIPPENIEIKPLKLEPGEPEQP